MKSVTLTTICDPPWESREKGERTGTRAMTRHAKRVAYPSDMHICNKQNKDCHGGYCFKLKLLSKAVSILTRLMCEKARV